MGIDTSGLDTETMQRVIAMAQERGLPLTPQTFNGLMELASAEGAGAATMNNGREDIDDPLGRFMSKTDGTAPLPAPVTSAPLHTTLPTQKPKRSLADMNLRPGAGMDEVAFGNMQDERAEGNPDGIGFNMNPVNTSAYMRSGDQNRARMRAGQGPARLNSHDAEAPDARGKPIDAEDVKNSPPGMQGMNDMGLEDSSAVGGMSGSTAAMAGGGLAALIATLTRRPKTALGSSNALNNASARLALPAPSSGPTIPMAGPDGWYPQKNNPGMRETGIPGSKMPASAIERSPVTGKRRSKNKSKKKDE